MVKQKSKCECKKSFIVTAIAEDAVAFTCPNYLCPHYNRSIIIVKKEDMGKLTQKLKEVRALEKDSDLLNRFKKTLCAQAIREYLGMNNDQILMVEIHLLEEEIMNRIGKGHPITHQSIGSGT